MKTRIVILIVALAALLACQQNSAPSASAGPDDMKSAAQTAIRTYLESRADLQLGNMTWEVKDVQAEGDAAVAQVIFRPKEGAGEMPVSYKLKKVEGTWVVDKGSSAGEGHVPTNHPPTGQ